jgi:large subunit ribosomal protein L6
MSRIGKIPVRVPPDVKVTFCDGTISVEGPKGRLFQEYHSVISFIPYEDTIVVERANEEKQSKAFHGLYRNLLNNMIIGTSKGFSKALIITGVGYKAEVQGKILILSLGYSNDVFIGIPEGLSVALETNSKLVISGIDKQCVGEFASQIRRLRKPEPYKGKGIRYEEEIIRRKVGKSGVK